MAAVAWYRFNCILVVYQNEFNRKRGERVLIQCQHIYSAPPSYVAAEQDARLHWKVSKVTVKSNSRPLPNSIPSTRSSN
jgi:hypothetical protein